MHQQFHYAVFGLSHLVGPYSCISMPIRWLNIVTYGVRSPQNANIIQGKRLTDRYKIFMGYQVLSYSPVYRVAYPTFSILPRI